MLYISREVATFTPPKTNILPEAAGFVNTLFTYMPSAYTLHTGIHYTYNTVYTCQVSTLYIYSLYKLRVYLYKYSLSMPGVYILHIQSIQYMPGV